MKKQRLVVIATATMAILLAGCEKAPDCAELAKATDPAQKKIFFKECPNEAREAAAAQFRAGEYKHSPAKSY